MYTSQPITKFLCFGSSRGGKNVDFNTDCLPVKVKVKLYDPSLMIVSSILIEILKLQLII